MHPTRPPRTGTPSTPTPFAGRALACLGIVAAMSASPTFAADANAKTTPTASKKAPAASKAKAAAVDVVPAPANAEQISASERVYYGPYDCDFKQVIHIAASTRHPAYVELRHGKAEYLMKPVLSSTGAVRLEDVKGQTLMIQIASKSMLMNVKSGVRLVDACVSPSQRAAIDAANATAAAPAGASLLATPNP